MLGHADLHAERLLDDHEFQVTAGRQERFAGRCRVGSGGSVSGSAAAASGEGSAVTAGAGTSVPAGGTMVLVAACAEGGSLFSSTRIAFQVSVRAAAGEFPPPVAVVPAVRQTCRNQAEQRQAMQQD